MLNQIRYQSLSVRVLNLLPLQLPQRLGCRLNNFSKNFSSCALIKFCQPSFCVVSWWPEPNRLAGLVFTTYSWLVLWVCLTLLTMTLLCVVWLLLWCHSHDRKKAEKKTKLKWELGGSENRLRSHGMSKSQTKYIITNSFGTIMRHSCNCQVQLLHTRHRFNCIWPRRAQQVAETLAQSKQK